MLKFGGTINDGTGRLIGIGLSRENWDRLLRGQPITFDLAELGLAVCDKPGGTGTPFGPPMDGRIVIMGGETEESMQDELREKVGLPSR